MDKRRPKIVMTEEASTFLKSLPISVQKKIAYNVSKVEEGVIDNELYKKLDGTNIWELRTLFNNIKYRLFTFWDTDGETLIIATHGIIKKTQKIPLKEIARAEAIRKEYFENKNR